ncbi:hypothetical protein RN001_007778 [Aquatica leii]|uniref:TIL domain-containing protein n=1 Tax=Aquatica leii TaxID=1421715 RepID=A0AAN7SFQ0_9COLE|nr:hypothetical protein RN001_007778 [Aquatica leii]
MLEEEQSLLNGRENNEENSQELNENRKMAKADKEQETVRRRNEDEDLNGEQPQISDEEYRKNANEDEGKTKCIMARLLVILCVSLYFILGAIYCHDCGEHAVWKLSSGCEPTCDLPFTPKPIRYCGKHEVWKLTLGCEPSCKLPVIPSPWGCVLDPVVKCVCVKGYYRNKNECVLLSECPVDV